MVRATEGQNKVFRQGSGRNSCFIIYSKRCDAFEVHLSLGRKRSKMTELSVGVARMSIASFTSRFFAL